jgi:cytochrome c553
MPAAGRDRALAAGNPNLQRRIALPIPSLALATLVALGSAPAWAQAADPNLGRNLAATCANCHGTDGRSAGGTPSLAGSSAADLVRKMQDYKAGKTPATVMHQLAKGYTDEQITLVAGWFATQKPAQ